MVTPNGTFWITKQIKKITRNTVSIFGQQNKQKEEKKREKKLPDSKNRKNTTTQEFSSQWHTCSFNSFVGWEDIGANFSFRKIFIKKTFFVPEKDFKILRLRSHKRKKKFAASKTIFLKRDIIFRFADILAPIYKWSNRKIQDSPFTQVTFFEHMPQQQQKNS